MLVSRNFPRITPLLSKRSWTCKSCLGRRSSSTDLQQKPFYITTPIFYVNGEPHIGHLYSLITADVIARFQRLNGRKAILSTGTDEYGLKVYQAATAAGIPTKIFCDKGSEKFKNLLEFAHVDCQHFNRTTDSRHKTSVQHFWNELYKKGYIYKANHQGWYSISDETFYPKVQVEERHDTTANITQTFSRESGSQVHWTSEPNYHFKLSKMKDRLLEFYDQNPNFVLPDSRYQEIIESVRSGLDDLSISRPTSRLSWGIPVPGDEEHTIYVWLDALINYISCLGYPGGITEWPADIHVVGKDITRFHCIHWPAFLLALGMQPPKKILTHSHWMMNNMKMSKSRGNVVDPLKLVEYVDIDAVRYYLMEAGKLGRDSDFSTDSMLTTNRKQLMGKFGNLICRVFSTTFNIPTSLELARTRKISPIGNSGIHLLSVINKAAKMCPKAMKEGDISQYIYLASRIFLAANKYLQETEPWTLKTDAMLKESIIYHAVEAIRISAIWLLPIMPNKMTDTLNALDVPLENRVIAKAKVGTDLEYGKQSRKPMNLFTAMAPMGRYV